MKSTLCICNLSFAFLLAFSIMGLVGCGDDEGGDTLTHEEKLAGTYTLFSVEVEENGVSITLRPPDISGSFVLNAGGSWSASLGIPSIGFDEASSGSSWSATAALIIYDEGTPDPYTLTGNTLVLTYDENGEKIVATFKK